MAVMVIFNQLLQRPKDGPIELDRVLRPTASSQNTILFNDTPVMLLPDLSRQTLAMRKALNPFITNTMYHHFNVVLYV